MSGATIEVTGTANMTSFVAAVTQSEASLRKFAETHNLTVTQARKVQSAHRRHQKQLERLNRAQRKTTAGSTGLQAAFVRLVPAASSATASLGAMGVAATGAMGPLGLIVGAIATIAGVAMSSGGKLSDFIDEVEHGAEASGLSTQGYLALSSAIIRSGGDAKQATKAMQSFVQTQDLAGASAAEVEQALITEVNRINALESSADRASERIRVFGTRNAEALSKLTGEGMRKAKEETASLGDLVEKNSELSGEWDEAFARLSEATTLLTMQLGEELGPSVVSVTNAFSDIVLLYDRLSKSSAGRVFGWLKYLTGGWVFDAVSGLGKALSFIVKQMSDLAGFNRTFIEIGNKKTKTLQESEEAWRKEQEAAEANTKALQENGEKRKGALTELFELQAKEQEEQEKREQAALRAAKAREQDRAAFKQKIASETLAIQDYLAQREIQAIADSEEREKARFQEELGLLGRAYAERIEAAEKLGEDTTQIEANWLAEQEDLERGHNERLHEIREERLDEERRAVAERQRLRDMEEEQDQRHAEAELRRLQELKAMRQDAAIDGIRGLSALAEAAGGSARTIAAAKKFEAIAYQTVAFARNFAELGFIAAIPASAAMLATLAPEIAKLSSPPSFHMGGRVAPDEGIVKVRNNETIVEPATANGRGNGQGNKDRVMSLQVGTRFWRAMSKETDRQSTIFGARRTWAEGT